MPSIPFEDGTIQYDLHGSGERTLLLIHGFGEDRRVWDEFRGVLPKKGLRVLTLDLPGFGGSDSLLPESIDRLADSVAAVVSDAGLSHWVAVGHSMGGYTTLNLLRRYPDLPIRGLGLFHSHPYADPEEKKGNREKTAAFIRNHGSPAFAESFVPNMFAPAYVDKHPQWVEKLVERASAYSPQAMSAALLAMRDRREETDTLQQASIPILFLLGKEDRLADFEAVLPQVLLPDTSQVHFLEGVGHMGMFEAPDTCAQAVESFVEFCYRRTVGG